MSHDEQVTYAKGDRVRIVGGSAKWLGLVFVVESDAPLAGVAYGPLLAAGPRPDGLAGDFRWPREQLALVDGKRVIVCDKPALVGWIS